MGSVLNHPLLSTVLLGLFYFFIVTFIHCHRCLSRMRSCISAQMDYLCCLHRHFCLSIQWKEPIYFWFNSKLVPETKFLDPQSIFFRFFNHQLFLGRNHAWFCFNHFNSMSNLARLGPIYVWLSFAKCICFLRTYLLTHSLTNWLTDILTHIFFSSC